MIALPFVLAMVCVSAVAQTNAAASVAADRRMTLVGRVSDVFVDDTDDDYLFLSVATESGMVYVAHRSCDVAPRARKLSELIGCDVRIVGRAFSVDFPYNRRMLGRMVELASTNDLAVLSRPIKGLFNAPVLEDAPPPLARIDTCGPRRVRGTVLARWRRNRFLVRSQGGDAIRVALRGQQSLPAVGASVEAVGKVVTDLYRYGLEQAQWRPQETGGRSADNQQPSSSTSLSELFFLDGRYIVNSVYHGATLAIRGKVKDLLTDESGTNRMLVEDGRFKIVIDCSAVPEALAGVTENCQVEVSGVCVMESENWHSDAAFPKVSGLILVPRTPADVAVTARPAWWTPAKLLGVVLGLLAVLAGILVWNASLRVLVARKSREVLREQTKRLSETLKIDERTRLAAELHDFHSQNLTAIAYRLSSAIGMCERDPAKTRELLAMAANMLKSCRTDLRRCLWDLRNDALDDPDFAKAIRETVTPVAGTASVSVRFAGHRSQISDSTAHALLSILRELTANAVVHGHAAAVRIAGELRQQMARFSVKDDGCGFDVSSRLGQDEGHFGIDGIRERLNRLGGSLQIDSTPGHGTYVRLTISHGARDPSASQPLNATTSQHQL